MPTFKQKLNVIFALCLSIAKSPVGAENNPKQKSKQKSLQSIKSKILETPFILLEIAPSTFIIY